MNDETAVLVCLFDNEYYALPLNVVREVVRWRVPTPVPGSPNTLPGVIHQRGVVLPVVDVRPLLGIASPAPSAATRLIVAEVGELQAAVVADRVDDIWHSAAAPEAVPGAMPAEQAQYLSGLVYWQERPVGVLQLNLLLQTIRERARG